MRTTSTRLMAIGAVAGLLALTACGSDDDDSSTTDAPTEETTAATDDMAETTDDMAETTDDMAETTDDMAETTDDMAETGTIVDVAVDNGSFTTLVAAVEAAGLVETLSGEGPLTVFAPTDDAFAALPDGVLDALLLPENQEILVSILTYHVVPGAVMSTDLVAGDVETVEGDTVAIALDGGVTVNDANVVTADVEASNGVIHVIDAVLLPPDVDPAALVG